MSTANGLWNSSISTVTVLVNRFHLSWLGYVTSCLDAIFRLSDTSGTFCSQPVPGMIRFKKEHKHFLPSRLVPVCITCTSAQAGSFLDFTSVTSGTSCCLSFHCRGACLHAPIPNLLKTLCLGYSLYSSACFAAPTLSMQVCKSSCIIQTCP